MQALNEKMGHVMYDNMTMETEGTKDHMHKKDFVKL